MFNGLKSKIAAIACSLSLACALLPAAAFEALAYDGDVQIVQDGIVYVVNGSRDVRLSGVVRAADIPAVVTVPSTVSDADGRSYRVSNIEENAFKDCTNMRELRIADLVSSQGSAGQVYPSAFTGCSNLGVIHLLGHGRFVNGTHTSYNFDRGLDGLKLVLHDHAAVVSVGVHDFSGHLSGVQFPNMTLYYAVDFVQGGKKTTAFVEGPSGTWNSARTTYTVTAATTCAGLASARVYTDGDLCTGTVPQLGSGTDAWAFTSLDDDGRSVLHSADSDFNCTGTATAVDSADLSHAVMTLASDDLRYTSRALAPDVTVTRADGSVADASSYALSYFAGASSAQGMPVDASDVIEPGTYTVAARGDVGGTCEASFTVTRQVVAWKRVAGADRYAQAQAIAATASDMISTAGTDAQASKKFRVLVNPDDAAACATAVSLAGVLGCTVLTTGAKELSRAAAVQLAGASNATVVLVGPAKELSAAVKTAVDGYCRGSLRIDGSTPAQLASSANTFVTRALAGDYGSVELEEGFTGTVLVLPEDVGPASFAAAAWAAGERARILFAPASGGIDAEQLAGAQRIVLAGVAPEAVAGAPAQAAVEDWGAGEDAFRASAAYSLHAVDDGGLSLAALALVPPQDSGVLAAAAAACALAKGVLVCADGSESGSYGVALLDGPLAHQVVGGYAFGGYAGLPASLLEEMQRIWDAPEDGNLRFSTVTAGNVTATGSAVAPKVTVVDRSGKELVKGVDYTLSYIDNATNSVVKPSQLKSAGSYTVVCTGTRHEETSSTFIDDGGVAHVTEVVGTYYNARSAVFSVKAPAKPAKPSGLRLSAGKGSLKASWSKAARAKSYQLAYRAKGAKAWKAKAAASAKLSLKGLKKGKSYQVRVRAKGVSGWGAWSAVKTSKKVK